MSYSCQAVEGRLSFDSESLTNIIQIQTIRPSDDLTIISAGFVHWVYYDHDQLPSPYDPKQQCEGISGTAIVEKFRPCSRGESHDQVSQFIPSPFTDLQQLGKNKTSIQILLVLLLLFVLQAVAFLANPNEAARLLPVAYGGISETSSHLLLAKLFGDHFNQLNL